MSSDYTPFSAASKQDLDNSRITEGGDCLFLLAGHVASAPRLETDDDVCDLHVPLLLQVGEDPCSEEHFTLADPVQVGI